MKGGKIDFKVEKAGIVHVAIGKASMSRDAAQATTCSRYRELIVRLKPSTAKGTYVKSVAISSTMGPGIRIDPNEIVRLSRRA